jgi:phasin family protein
MAKTATKKTAATAAKAAAHDTEMMTKGIETLTTFGQENVEAVVASSKIAAKAAESMGTEIAAYAKKAYEDSLAAAKDLTTCKSVPELIQKQTAFAKVSVEAFVGEAAKLQDIYAAAAKEALAPLNARFCAAAEAAKDFRA